MIVENVNGFYDEEYKTYYIVGYLKNKTKDEYRNIDIEYRVYDEENNILGNTDFTDHCELLFRWGGLNLCPL